MQLLVIMCDASLEDRILERLRGVGVPGYTRIPDTTGFGRTGRRDGDPIWPGMNSVLLVAAPDEDLVSSIRELLIGLKAEYTRPPALHMFALPAVDLM